MEKQYIETLLAQIREKRARECIRTEVAGHILDQKACYIACGMSDEQAEAQAVADMGDPVETGIALDEIHRPKPAWGMLAAIAVLCAAGVLLQFAAYVNDPDAQMGRYFYQSQLLYAVCGFFLLCSIYLVDYTKIAKYSRYLCTGILVLLSLAAVSDTTLFPRPYPQASLNIGFFKDLLFPDILNTLLEFIHLDAGRLIALNVFFYLYLPLYGAVLYSYRKCSTKKLLPIFLYTVLPIFLSSQLTHASVRMNLAVIMFLMLGTAVKKGWFPLPSIKAKYLLFTGIAGILTLLTACSSGYQRIRIQAWLRPASFEGSEGYLHGMIRHLLRHSQLIGKNTSGLPAYDLPGYTTDYIVSYTISTFGFLAAALLIFIVVLLGVKLLRLSVLQKNQLGMMMGLGCSLAFVIQSAEYILVNLALLPASSLYLPLISFGGSNMLQTCVLLGILLSIYRYENVVAEPLPAAGSSVVL